MLALLLLLLPLNPSSLLFTRPPCRHKFLGPIRVWFRPLRVRGRIGNFLVIDELSHRIFGAQRDELFYFRGWPAKAGTVEQVGCRGEIPFITRQWLKHTSSQTLKA